MIGEVKKKIQADLFSGSDMGPGLSVFNTDWVLKVLPDGWESLTYSSL